MRLREKDEEEEKEKRRRIKRDWERKEAARVEARRGSIRRWRSSLFGLGCLVYN